MTNKDIDFEILMRFAAKAYIDEEVGEFNAMDTSDITISEKTTQKVKRAIWKATIRDSRGMIVLKKVLVASMLICTVLFTSMMCIQPVRAAFWDAVVTWYEDHIGILFVQEDTVEYPTIIEKKILPDLPEGWTLSVIEESQTLGFYLISDLNGEQILYHQMPVQDNEPWYDDTGCTIETIVLNTNIKAYLFTYEDGRLKLVWVDNYLFSLHGEQITSAALIDLAESIDP